MSGRQHARPGRSLAAAGAALLLCGGAVRTFQLTGVAALDAVRESGPDAPADLLVLGAAGAGLVLVLWLGAGVLLAILGTLPGAAGRLASVAADRISPPLVRRATAVVLGTTLVATAAPLAQAAETLPMPLSTARVTVAPVPDPAFGVTTGAPVVDAPVVRRDLPPTASPAAPDPAFTAPNLGPLGPSPGSTSLPRQSVTVARGDNLWLIVARHLGPGATRHQIAREWPRWYAANRAVIGPDPDLIRVGQVLTVPGAAS